MFAPDKFFINKIKGTVFEYVLVFIYAFLGVSGVSYIAGIIKDNQLSGSLFSLLLYALLIVMYIFVKQNARKCELSVLNRRLKWSFFTSFIMGILLVMGYQLEINHMTECGFLGKLHILFEGFLVLFALLPFVYFVYYALEKIASFKLNECANVKTKKIFFISWGVIFASFIPAFLAYWPIIMSYDFHAQVLMSERGYIWFSQHHPQIHTFQISVFYNLGKAINNVQLGMSFMAIFHMLVMSVCLAYAVLIVSKLIPSRKTPFIVTAVVALYPINAVMTVSTTKDVMFSALVVLFLCTLFDRFYFAGTRQKKIIMDICVVLSGILMSLYRMNASYAVLAAGLVLIIFVPKKYKLLILMYTVLIFAGFKLSYSGIRAALKTQIGTEPAEKYSAIIQAFARVGYYHADELDAETEAIISRYVPKESWVEYNPQLSDPCKAGAGMVYWDNWAPDMGRTFTDFIKIGLKYPNEYIDSFLETNRGYWFIDDTSYATCLGEGLEGRMGVLYTYNSSYSEGEVEEIKHESKWPFMEYIYENIVSANCFMNWPIISIFFKTAFYSILLVWLFFMFIYSRNNKALLMLMFIFIYFLTLLLGPIVQIRYSFPYMLAEILFVPLLFKNVVNKPTN